MPHTLFTKYIPPNLTDANFESLSKVFFQLINMTSGDVDEALSWMTELDNKYGFSNAAYGMGDFIEDLKDKGYISDKNKKGEFEITAKSEQTIRKSALDQIFGKLKKSNKGNHNSNVIGSSQELTGDTREYQFGDHLHDIDFNHSIQNSFKNNGLDHFSLNNDDIVIKEREHMSSTATVLLIDISHSMILYGEDRITPAKNVAMALSELIMKKYPKDSLDIVVFGNDAWPVTIKELPYLKVGPYHTNTYAGLEMALNILRKKKTPNKQIFMITDGKPTCLKIGIKYYKNSWGLDPKVINKVLNMAGQCRRLNIPITTFMIAKDPYLQEFVQQFTATNGGKAYYSSLNGLGEYIFEDFINNKKRTVR